MIMNIHSTIKVSLFAVILYAASAMGSAYAFSTGGCDGDCRKCHSLTYQEAYGILTKTNAAKAKILSIQLSPVKSLWEVSIDDSGRRGIVYVDFSKKYIVAGSIIEVGNGTDKTRESYEKIRKVDFSKIPLENALILGNRHATKKVVVFTDPDCPFCSSLHQELKKVVSKRKDIAFFLKIFPLKNHKDSYWKAKSIMCNKSIGLLEENFEKKSIARTECNAPDVDDTVKIAASLDITGTPTIVFPNGRVHTGTMPAEKLIELIDDGRK